jgi:hypothetical protein
VCPISSLSTPKPLGRTPPTHPPTLPLPPLYLIQIIDERRCTRELERQREKETDGLDTAPKAPTALAPGPGPGQAQLMGVKRVVVVGREMHSFTFNIYSHPLCRVRGNRIFTISDYVPDPSPEKKRDVTFALFIFTKSFFRFRVLYTFDPLCYTRRTLVGIFYLFFSNNISGIFISFIS